MPDECKGCEKLEGQISKLETKLAARETDLEKSLDDLATASAERDEAVKKANRIAKAAEEAGAGGGSDADSSGSGENEDGDSEKPSLLSRAINWPFGA